MPFGKFALILMHLCICIFALALTCRMNVILADDNSSLCFCLACTCVFMHRQAAVFPFPLIQPNNNHSAGRWKSQHHIDLSESVMLALIIDRCISGGAPSTPNTNTSKCTHPSHATGVRGQDITLLCTLVHLAQQNENTLHNVRTLSSPRRKITWKCSELCWTVPLCCAAQPAAERLV